MTSPDLEMLAVLLGIAAIAGISGGVLAGLLGVGGGIVIVPALYFAMKLIDNDPATTMQVAVGTSLATIAFTSISSARGHYRRGVLDMTLLRKWTPFIFLGVVVGAAVGGVVSGNLLIAVFATVAAIVSVDMLLRRPDTEGRTRQFPWPLWAGSGLFAGAISAMMGIGGGTLCVPILNFLGYDMRKAVGSAAAIGFVISGPAVLIYVATGWERQGLPPFSLGYVNILAAIVIVPLTMSFAQFGVRIAHSISLRALRICFGIFLGLTSIRMFFDLHAALQG